MTTGTICTMASTRCIDVITEDRGSSCCYFLRCCCCCCCCWHCSLFLPRPRPPPARLQGKVAAQRWVAWGSVRGRHGSFTASSKHQRKGSDMEPLWNMDVAAKGTCCTAHSKRATSATTEHKRACVVGGEVPSCFGSGTSFSIMCLPRSRNTRPPPPPPPPPPAAAASEAAASISPEVSSPGLLQPHYWSADSPPQRSLAEQQ